uniref:Uncharacterized protein n=1 Tax=Sphaerodactylus townsendi TaxID=933632 RepID=A0ACB8F7P6_9SAUR
MATAAAAAPPEEAPEARPPAAKRKEGQEGPREASLEPGDPRAGAARPGPGRGRCPRGDPLTHDPVIETAEEATEPAEVDINGLCKDMFNKMAIYLTGELTASSEDYRLLENMNKLTSLKYLEMKDIAINISRNLKDLNQKYAGLQPYLDQISLIEEQVAALEQAAYKLDAYSKKLEAKYKKLEKR